MNLIHQYKLFKIVTGSLAMNQKKIRFFIFLFFIFTTTLRSAALRCDVDVAPPSFEYSSYIVNKTGEDVTFEIEGRTSYPIKNNEVLKLLMEDSGPIHFYSIKGQRSNSPTNALLPRIVATFTSPSSSATPSPIPE
jgi:hypothetical protein